MIEFIQNHLTEILTGGGVGAVVGGIVGLLMNRSAHANKLNEAMAGEVRSLMTMLDQFKHGLGSTKGAFAGLISLLVPDQDMPLQLKPEARHDGRSNSNETPDEHTAPEIMNSAGGGAGKGLDLAQKLLAAVLAIPALPKLPDLSRDFDMMQDNDILDTVFSQLKGLDTDGINTMIGEFKSLVETTLKPGIERARDEGLDFVLEPETIETLTKGAGEFVKSIGGMSAVIDQVIGRLDDVLDQFVK